MNKIVIYDPHKLNKTIPQYFNEILTSSYSNEKITYLTFVMQDLSEQCKDFNKFTYEYKLFLEKWNLPYVFFPYYAYFNKLIPRFLGLPNPKLAIKINENETINMIMSPAYGFLMLDIKKLKAINFKFNEDYTELFYIQDLIQKCFEAQLWCSNCCFIDRFNSWEDLNNVTLNGYMINSNKFNIEKQKYDELNITYHSPNEFVKIFKEQYKL
jgi:hypothetical protein